MGRLPRDGLQDASIGAGEGRDHVDLGDVDGEDQLAAQVGLRDRLGPKIVDSRARRSLRNRPAEGAYFVAEA